MREFLFFDAHTHSRLQGSGECRILSIDAGNDCSLPSADRLFTAGLHPWFLNAETDFAWEKLHELVAAPNCVAIGECGLDFIRGDKNFQYYWFMRQVELAQEFKKPLVLHVVKAHEQAREILKASNFRGRLYLHGFRGKWNVAEAWLKTGAFIGISPAALKNPNPIFFKNINKEKLLCESDDSDWTLETIFAATASCLDMDMEAWKQQCMKNAKLFYDV